MIRIAVGHQQSLLCLPQGPRSFKIRDKMMKDFVTQSILRCATHSTSMRCRGGDENAYEAHTMTSSVQPIRQICESSFTARSDSKSPNPEVGKAWLASEPRTLYGVHATSDTSSTAFHARG